MIERAMLHEAAMAARRMAERPTETCLLEWGARGAQRAAMRGDVVVIVDTLRFSTTVATAVHHGACVRPCLTPAEQQYGQRGVTPRYTLSPGTFAGCAPGERVALYSLNGAVCSRMAASGTAVHVGALVNARAVASAVARLVSAGRPAVTIVPCGERDPSMGDSDAFRMAVEDYLAAGAILSYLPFRKSSEAMVCEQAFIHSADSLESLLWNCESGIELRDKGRGEDVVHAAQLNLYNTTAAMVGDWLVGQSRIALMAE